MPAERLTPPLIERLPSVRGKLYGNEPLDRFTWFKVGGPADVLFRPADVDDLSMFLAACPSDVPVMVMGNASNMLVRDGGVRGVVVRLGRAFQTIRMDGEFVHAGAGAADLSIARAARDAGLAGLEFLAGIPGTIGGAVFMNAGAYGNEVKDVLAYSRAIRRDGTVADLPASEITFDYRCSSLSAGEIVTDVTLKAACGNVDAIRERMTDIQALREESQPVRTPTGGSTFKNPAGASAWELIDAAGCRGLRHGGAMVSEKHCNFLVNAAGATATDLETLGEEVCRRVMAHAGVQLEWEIQRVGEPAESGLGKVAV